MIRQKNPPFFEYPTDQSLGYQKYGSFLMNSLIFQLLVDLSEMRSPLFLHDISALKTSLGLLPKEACPIFAHNDIDIKRDEHLFVDHLYVPANKLFSRYTGNL